MYSLATMHSVTDQTDGQTYRQQKTYVDIFSYIIIYTVRHRDESGARGKVRKKWK